MLISNIYLYTTYGIGSSEIECGERFTTGNLREVVSKSHLRPNGCVAVLFYGSSRLRRDCAFPSGLTLDAYLNLSKIRYVIPLSGVLEPDLEF